jgi:hypothetical protein
MYLSFFNLMLPQYLLQPAGRTAAATQRRKCGRETPLGEALINSPAVISGSFATTFQFEKLEIHTVFLRFPNFNLRQNLSLILLVSLISASL